MNEDTHVYCTHCKWLEISEIDNEYFIHCPFENDCDVGNCCGSGSIPLSAKLENRNYIGMDNGICEKKNSEYDGLYWAEIAENRLKNT